MSRPFWPAALALSLTAALTGCASLETADLSPEPREYLGKHHFGSGKPYRVRGRTYYPMTSSRGYREIGVASWYGSESGNRTASGQRFNPNGLSAAHKTLPLFTSVRVTNLENGKSAVVTVNDRGPFVPGRLIDVSQAAAQRLNMQRRGSSKVLVEALN
ncbi:MAG: septal ring lytic transglycosylase RlpA family protein [Methylococcaceae bacterium]|nr:septal ring lytic transglycosylase RlpA family protein [Methylococcaceae bacterium]